MAMCMDGGKILAHAWAYLLHATSELDDEIKQRLWRIAWQVRAGKDFVHRQ